MSDLTSCINGGIHSSYAASTGFGSSFLTVTTTTTTTRTSFLCSVTRNSNSVNLYSLFQMLMNAAKALMTASLTLLLVQIPLVHTAVPVMLDTWETERQAAK